MAPPVVSQFASDLYEDLEPLAYADAENGYALLTLCGALGALFQPIDDLVRDSPDGPGWSSLLDIDRSPTDALPWLAQFVGVQLTPGLSDAQERAQIRAETGMQRGTVASIKAAAAKLLTGTQTVQLIERTPDPYSFTVITAADETPDPAAVEAALMAAKPAGLILNYNGSVTGQTWAQLIANYSTWAAVVAAFPTWQDVINNTP